VGRNSRNAAVNQLKQIETNNTMANNEQPKPPGAGKSSLDLIDPDILFRYLDLKKGSVMLDAGSGAGAYSLAAVEHIGNEGLIYAVDMWEEGIATLKNNIDSKGINTIRPITADIRERIPVIDDHSVDICLMATVLHDIVETGNASGALSEIARVLRPKGQLAIIEFKKIEGPPGPPLKIRLSPDEVEHMVAPFRFRKQGTPVEVGAHNYLVMFHIEVLD